MLIRGKAHKAQIDTFFRKAIDYQGDDCLIWPFGKTKAGYGMIRRDGKRLYVHRLLCRIRYGAAPKERPDAAHSCRNSACVNPRHLRWASHRESLAVRPWHPGQKKGRAVTSQTRPSR